MKKILAICLALGLVFVMAACGGGGTSGSGAAAGGDLELSIGQVEGAPHGDRSFAVTTVVTSGDTVVKAYFDEYQFLSAEDATGVPNSDGSFGENYPEGMVLASKRENNDMYSENMKEAGATKELVAGYEAIEAYVAGKTVAELEELVAKDKEEVVDAVADSTLEDTQGYIQTVIDAAKAAEGNPSVTTSGSTSDIKLGFVNAAAHGEGCFTVAAAAVNGDTVVLSYIDEFQFLASDGTTGVPNSDGVFGENYPEDFVLASKRANDASYSAMMEERGGATKALGDSYNAVQDYANGKTMAELEELVAKDKEEVVDAVADSTLEDTKGYLEAIIEAAKAAA